MSIHRNFSRRGFLKGAAVAAGAAAGTRLAGRHWIEPARAGGNNSAFLIVHLNGGFNSVFPSADSFLGKTGTNFGITGANSVMDLGNGLSVDAASYGANLPQFALQNMATIGTRHGQSAHGAARTADWFQNNMSSPLQLAAAMGGDAAIKAVSLGGDAPGGTHNAVNGVSMQRINDMQSTIDALGGGTPNPTVPDRGIAATAIERAGQMSQRVAQQNPLAMVSAADGYGAAVETLRKPVKPFSFPDLATAYGKNANQTAVNDFTSRVMAAELMITAGANVAVVENGGWDSHGDRTAQNVRNKMNNDILPALSTFTQRMMVDAQRPVQNVTVIILGDFARSMEGSDHQPNLSVTVWGNNVKVGTTGKTSPTVALPGTTPGVGGLWSYLGALASIPDATNPFGPNPHPLVK